MITFHIMATVTSVLFISPNISARTLQSTLDAGNSHNGNMFDLCAISTPVQITSFDIHCQDATASINIYVATSPNQQYNGIKSASSSWTLIHDETVSCRGSGLVTILDTFNIVSPVIVTTSCRGFYITVTDGGNLLYSSGGAAGSVYSSDSYLQFLEGIGKEYPFATDYSPRIWNGIIHYNLYTLNPTMNPTSTTFSPTLTTSNPTKTPSISPTQTPITPPSISPSKSPSRVPTVTPTLMPPLTPTITTHPSITPTNHPIISPSTNPTQSPTIITIYPSIKPSNHPSMSPSINPTHSPTLARGGAVQETTKNIKATDENTFSQNDSSPRTNLTTILIIILIVIMICIACVGIVIYWRQKKIKDSLHIEGVSKTISNSETYEHEIEKELHPVKDNNVIDIKMQTADGSDVIKHVNLMNKYMYNDKVAVKKKGDLDVVSDINKMNYDKNETIGVDGRNVNYNEMLPPVIPAVNVTDMGSPQQNSDNDSSDSSEEQQTNFGETAHQK